MARVGSPKVFRGDGDHMVDALVEACLPTARPSLEAPSLPHLIGRELTPYFGSSEAAGGIVQDSKPNHATKRKGSPPNLMRPRATSPTAADAATKTPAATNAKVQRSNKQVFDIAAQQADAAKASDAIKAVPIKNKKKSPIRGSPERAAATAACRPASDYCFACPAMFSSPKPETLPLPSSSLLNQATRAMIRPTACVAA